MCRNGVGQFTRIVWVRILHETIISAFVKIPSVTRVRELLKKKDISFLPALDMCLTIHAKKLSHERTNFFINERRIDFLEEEEETRLLK